MRTRVRRAVQGLLVACALLAAAEGLTRTVAGSPTIPLVAELPQGTGGWFTEGEGTLQPTWQARDVIDPVPIAPEGPRVIWLGGSSVHGGNPDVKLTGEAPALAAALLGVDVVNLGGPGMDTGTIAAMLPDALRLRPDVVVFYEGHNDLGNAVFTNRYGDARTIWVARARGLLGFSRLFELLEGRIRAREVIRLPTPGTEGSYRVEPGRREVIHQRFEERLRSIARAVHAAGARLVLLTPVSNPLTPYLEGSCPREYATLGLRTFQRPEAIAVDRVQPEALAAALVAAPDCPELRLIAARHAADRGEAGALEIFDALRDEDPLPLRADRHMVETIRSVARTEGAMLVDVNAAFRELGGGIEPADYFIDFVHPSAEGYQAIAALAAPVIAGALGIGPPDATLPALAPSTFSACHAKVCRGGGGGFPGMGPPGPRGGGPPGR